MQCKSCNEVVAPKFIYALKTNICPFCGEAIVPDDLQVALSELGEVMLATEKYRAEIFEWLQANYNLIDTQGDEYKALQEKAEMVNKMPIKQAKTVDPKNIVLDNQGNQIGGEQLQDQSTTNKFMERANVKVSQQDRYRNIINQIKKGGSSSVEMSGGGGGGGSTLDVDEADPEEVMAMEGALSSGVPVVNSGLMSSDMDDDGEIPAVVEAMVQQASGSGGADYNAKDVAKLQALQSKSARAKKAMASGGSVGLIRR